MSNFFVNESSPFYEKEFNTTSGIPVNWQLKRIKDLSFLQSGSSITSDEIEDEGDYPVFGGNGFRGFYKKYTNEGSFILIGRQGALCGNINFAHGRFWASEHAIVVYPIKSINVRWYGEALRVMNLNQYSISAAQPGLSVDRIKRILIPVPPFSEQKAIADYLDVKTALIDQKIDLLIRKSEKYTQLKQALINETVTRGLDKSVKTRPSGIEWIGEVPEHWTTQHFKRVSYMKGRIGWQGLKHSEFIDKGPFLITGMNFKDGKIRWSEVYHISQERYEQAPEIQLKQDDVLMTKDGTIGKLLYIDEIPYPHKASLNSHLLVLRPLKNSYYPRYIFYQLESSTFKHYTDIVKTGTTFFGISQESVGKYIAVLPPINEQKAIASYLDEKTAKIDKIISTLNTQVEMLKELRRTLINDVVTGKIKVVE